MSALLRNPASVPSLFSRSVDEDALPPRPAARWRGALQAMGRPDGCASVVAADAGFAAALVDAPPALAASRASAGTQVVRPPRVVHPSGPFGPPARRRCIDPPPTDGALSVRVDARAG